MTTPYRAKAGSARRTRRGLVIEGEIVARRGSTPAPATSLPPQNLAARLSLRPYQSLLDDAMRLAGCRGPGRTATGRA